MIQIVVALIIIAILAFVWTLVSMKRDGYMDTGEGSQKESKNKLQKGSIIFFRDSVKHIK